MIGRPCPHCGGDLEPTHTVIERWACPIDPNHVLLSDEAGECTECAVRGKTTALTKRTSESHGYACKECGKSPLEAVSRPEWLTVEFEPEAGGMKGAFIPGHAQDYAQILLTKADSLAPCACENRWGLLRIGYAGDLGVRHVDGCCGQTINDLRQLGQA